MAKYYRPGDVKWVAYPDGVARVEVVQRGSRGYVLRNGAKLDNPYVVNEGGETYVLSEADLHDNPVEASKAVARMRGELGLSEFEEEEEELDEDDEDDEGDEEEFDEDEED